VNAFKLFRRRKDGTLGPLFINRRQVVPVGQWLAAEAHPTRGFAYRPGWHAAPSPTAPHLKARLASGERRVWCAVEVEDTVPLLRPASQGGTWFLAQRIKVVEVL
jgi:hypothetical protein